MSNQRPQDRAQAHWKTGVAAAKGAQWARAAEQFERATRLAPGDPVYWLNLGRARVALGEPAAGEQALQRALRARPLTAMMVRAASETLAQLHRRAEAADCFDALPPEAERDASFHSAHGEALFRAGRLQEAVQAYFRSLAMKMDTPLVHYRLGLVFMELGLREEAAECMRTAVALDDGAVRAMALTVLAYESRQACQWAHLAEETTQLREAIAHTNPDEGRLLAPFALLAVDCTPEEQLKVGRLRSAAVAKGVPALPPRAIRAEGRIRIGYLTGDVYLHATAVLMAELLEQRDRERFEVYLYSHSQVDDSRIRARVLAACDHVVDVTHLTHEQTARRMRADGIDIAVDLKGHTRDSRYEVLAWRPAPVQVSYLGYPATTGAEFIDYVIGDPVVTPMAHAGHFTEHIAQMPWSYQPNDRQRVLPPAEPRALLGLPGDAVVFCCFNQSYKITPTVLDLWARILAQVPRGVLWLLTWNEQAERNLRRELADRGVAGDRLVFGDKRPLAGHLARLRSADIFLDTWPCNAHTTASESLWAGVPVLTVPGDTFASRVAASLLRASGLAELVCADAEAYVAQAVALAQDPARLQALKQHLDSQRMALPLFDSARTTRDYEALLLRMAERARQGLPPAALEAAPSIDAAG